MSLVRGYLLIADISGYTAYLTSTELDHANPILRSLLEALVTEVGEPLNLWRMEGDAVLAYSSDADFPTGEAFLTICENLYNSFIRRRTDIRANTTCPCRACANIENLDLKILAHHGEFEEMSIGPMTDISGPAAILVHLMAKTDVKQATGVRSYALFSQEALETMGLEGVEMTPYTTQFDHFGEVSMGVYDLAKAWETYRDAHATKFIAEEDAIWSYFHRVRAPLRVVWEYMVNPELKQAYYGLISVTAESDGPRKGTGTAYHCVHSDLEFRYWITDWRPFEYFSTRIQDSLHPGLFMEETYALREDGDEVEIRYAMGPTLDGEGNRHEDVEADAIAFLSEFWKGVFGRLDEMLAARGQPA